MFARARGTRPHGDKMGGRTVFRLLLQNGWIKHRDLLRIFRDGVMQQVASVGTVQIEVQRRLQQLEHASLAGRPALLGRESVLVG